MITRQSYLDDRAVKRISVLTDFLTMQRLLAIEVDILTVIGENNMKNLWMNPEHKRSNTAVKVQNSDFKISMDDSISSLGNLQKLRYIEQELEIFYRVFTNKPSHTSNFASKLFVS